MAPVQWRDAERMGFAAFPVPKEPPPGGAGAHAAAAAVAVPRGIRAAPMPGSAAAAGADLYRDGSVAAASLPRPVTRVYQQSFNRSNLTYAVVAKGGAARDAEIIK